MLEIVITPDDIYLGNETAKTELSDFLTSSKNLISKNHDSPDIKKIVGDSIDVFVSTFYALTERFDKERVLTTEERRNEVISSYCLSCASTAVLNYIKRNLNREISLDDTLYSAPVKPSDLKGKSRYSFMSQSLMGLRNFVDSTGKGGNTVYKLVIYFGSLESFSANQARLACSDEGFENELSRLTPISKSERISFDYRRRTKKEQKSNSNGAEKVLAGDKLPDTLPEFSPSSASIERVVGNQLQLKQLKEYVLMALHYHPPSRKNFFWMDGNGFPEGVLIYGDPGVGKTFSAHALMNYAIEIARNKGLSFMPVSLDGHHIGSVYQNRSGQLLEHYFQMLKKGDLVYIVLMDEFDDLIPLGQNGQLSENAKQRLSAFKRSTGNSSVLGNYFIIAIANRISDENDIPIEVKDRFSPIFLPGPKTPSEYGQIVRNGLEYKERLGLVDPKIDWVKVGQYLIQWKHKLAELDDKELAVGRGYKRITQQLAATTKRSIQNYADDSLGKTPDFHTKFFSDKMFHINETAIYNAIDYTMEEQIRSRLYKRPGESIQSNKTLMNSIPQLE